MPAVVCLLAACGGEESADPAKVVDCLRGGGATVELDPPVSQDPAADADNFSPELSPDTKTFAAGRLSERTRVDVYVSTGGEADDAEDVAIKILRLFGLGKEYLMRRGTTLLTLRYRPRDYAEIPARDRDLARGCVDAG